MHSKQCTPLGPGYITARDQSMVESGVTEGVKHGQLSFSWMNTATQVRDLNLINKQRFLKLSQKFLEEKQQLLEEKDVDNIRKVLCKSFQGRI